MSETHNEGIQMSTFAPQLQVSKPYEPLQDQDQDQQHQHQHHNQQHQQEHHNQHHHNHHHEQPHHIRDSQELVLDYAENAKNNGHVHDSNDQLGGGDDANNNDDNQNKGHLWKDEVRERGWQPIARFTLPIVKNKWFDRIIILAILINCIFMALDDPQSDCNTPNPSRCSKIQQASNTAEYIFLAIFATECALKIISFSFIQAPDAYIKDNWNVLDFIVVIISFLSLVPSVGNLQALRTFRLLRSLRSISHIPAMRIVVSSLLRAMPSLLDVLLLVGFIIGVFAILGLHLFRGKLRQYCGDANGDFPPNQDDWLHCSRAPSGGYRCDPDSDYPICLKHAHISANPNYGITNFDHFGYALLTVFQICTAEGWTDDMYAMVDATSWGSVVFFLFVIWFGSMIGLSIMFAALENAWSEVDLSEQDVKQNEIKVEPWFVVAYRALEEKVPILKFSMARTWLGMFCKVIVDSYYFQRMVLLAIVVNTIVLAMTRTTQSSTEKARLDMTNIFLTAFFGMEMLLKLLGLGVNQYFSDNINKFDAFVVIISVVELSIAGSGIFSVFRAMRLLRILRLVRSWRSLNLLLQGLMGSVRNALALLMVLMLLLFVFALFGKNFFGGKVKASYNYDDFGWAFATVFCVFSGENWNSAMYEGMNGAGHGFAIFYVLLILLGNFVILKLFVAILLDGLQHVKSDDDPATRDAQLEKEVVEQRQKMNLFQKVPFFRKLQSQESALNAEAFAKFTESSKMDSTNDIQATNTARLEQPAMLAPSDSVLSAPTESKRVKLNVPIILPVARHKKTRMELLKERFDSFDSNNNGYIDESELKQLLDWCHIQLTMLEFSVIFSDDRFTFDEFISLMDAYNIELDVDDAGVVSVRGPTNKRKSLSFHGQVENDTVTKPVFTRAEKKILQEFDLDPELIASSVPVTGSDKLVLAGKSLFLFGPTNPLRRKCAQIIDSKLFNRIILVVICGSTLTVALDEPKASKSLKNTLSRFDIAFTICFVVEMLLKIASMGFVIGKTTYLRSSHFNQIDFMIVILSVATMFIGADQGGSQVSSLRAIRAFRALRPLRTIGRIPSLRIVMNALMQSMMPMLNAFALVLFFYLMFAILGVQLFAGKFHYCLELSQDPFTNSTSSGTNLSFLPDCPDCDSRKCHNYECVSCITTSSIDGMSLVVSNRKWENYVQNFDNVINAMVVLFGLSTLEGWTDVALVATSVTGETTWPKEGHVRVYFLYFMAFVLCGAFFASQLFAGVACDKYQRMNEFYHGTIFLTDKQKSWVQNAKNAVHAKPSRVPIDPIIPEFLPMIRHPLFDGVIIGTVLLNVVVLALYFENMPANYITVLETLNIVFVAIFGAEMVCKLLGLGPVAYVADHWNKFDAIVVLFSLISLMVNVGGAASVFRIFRLARVVKLIPRAQRLMAIVMTVMYSLPALFNVGMLMLLLFVIYACMGMNLFGTTVHGAFLTDHANFESFPIAMLTLFRITTGENWNGIMFDCAIAPGNINSGGNTCSSKDNNCGFNVVSQIFFISFVVIAWFVLMNLVVAAVLIAFEESRLVFSEGLTQRMIDDFKLQWAVFDPDADARIPVTDFYDLFNACVPIFNWSIQETTMDQMLKKIEVVDGQIRFSDALYVFAFERFGTVLGGSKPAEKLERKLMKQEKKLDGELDPKRRTVIPRLTEKQVMDMTADQLREELRKRGAVRLNIKTMGAEQRSFVDERRRQASISPNDAMQLPNTGSTGNVKENRKKLEV